MKFFTKSLQVLLVVVLLQQIGKSQTCPSINSQVGTGASTTICSGQCANLTASVVATKATTTYSVGSIAYSPFAYTGGATLPSVDDVWSDSLNIGFNFCYFGNTYSKLVIGSNGEINFNKSLANTFNNYNLSTILPNTVDLPGNSICGIFKDIDLSAGGVARTYVTGTAPCRKFVAYWSNVPLYQSSTDNCGTILNTFQIVLYETTNQVEVYVASTAPCGLGGNTDRGIIGIQNLLGTTAVAPASRNTLSSWTANNEGWRFNPTGVNTFTVNWSGPNSFTATGLTAAPCPTATSNYTATMNVTDCSGSITSFSSSVQVSVTPIPSITAVSNPSILCRGSAATITASGATSYTWSPGGAATSSIAVSPTVTTTYTILGANGTCSSTTTFTLPVSILPTITATSNPTVICSGTGSATLTGGGGTTYTWNPGGLIGSPVVVSPTIATQYTVTGANTAGCARTRTVNVNVSLSPTVTASASSPTACAGSTITLSSSGANTYTWAPGNLVGATVVATPTANTTYTVRGRNAGGCIGTETVNVTVSPGITFSVSATPSVICRGNSSTLTATGATSYTWSPGSLTSSVIVVSPIVTTNYTVTGSSGGSCSATKTIAVTVSIPNIVATKTPTAVCAGNSGTLTAAGGVTYTWNPGALTGNTVVVTPAATTIYTVTGTNALGCTNTRTISLPVLANPTINIAATNASLCPGFTTTLSASGGTSYTWSPGSFTTTNIAITPTVSGTYSVIGQNASGCTTTKTVDITVFPSVTVAPVASPSIICRGNASTLTVSGATSYTWNPGVLTGSNVAVSPSVSATYTVSGTSSNGCIGTNTLGVNVATLSVNATSNPTILCSASTATLTGTGANTYTWNPGGITGNTIVVTPASTTIYTVTGTNTSGCTATKTLNLSVGTTPTITANTSSSTICAAASITLSSSGGTSYTWTPGSVTGASVVVNPSVTTTYTVRGANASGCSATNTIAITVNPNPTVVSNANPTVLCPTFSSTLTASGTAVSYTWNPGAIANSSIVVTPSTTTVYTVVGTSSLGCTTSATVNLKVNPSPTVSATASQTSICSGATTSLTANGAFSYTWNPGALTGSVVTVSPGINTTYTLTGNNGLGCIDNATISINVNATPSLSIGTSTTTVCSAGSVTLTASGGTTYTWSPIISNTASVVDNPTVTTTYTVSSDNGPGCIGTQTTTINVVAYPTLTLSASSNTICSGNNATLTATGATSYTWNPGSLTTASVVVTPTTTTTYTVNGDNGTCSTTQTITLAVTPNLTITASATSPTICAGATTSLTASGATSYTWNPGALSGATVAVTPATSTIYTVTGANGSCNNTQTVSVTVNALPTLTATSNPMILCVGNTATLTGSGALTYIWNPGALTGTTIIVTPSVTTIYTVTGTSASGCVNTETLSLTVSNPTINAISSSTAICAGASATLTGSGASSYTWNPVALSGATIAVTPSATTIYTVVGTSTLGCTNSTTLSVTVNSNPTLSVAASANTICAGNTTTLGAIGAVTYTWNPSGATGFTVTVNPTVTTTYSVTGANATGCSTTNTITINVIANPTITANASPTIICSGSTSTLTSSGSTNYTWTPGSLIGSSVTVTPTVTTTYTVISDNGLGCMNTETITVNVNTPPTLSASSNTICSGNNATLTATGAISYTWNPGALTTSAVVVTPTATTTYTVDADNGTCVITQTIMLAVSPNLTVTASATSNTICSGSTTTLTGSGATSYTWNPGVLTGTNVVVSPTVTTTYNVSGDNGLGCVANNTIMITVNSAPIVSITASPSALCSAGSVTLTASGGTTYTWSPVSAATASVVDNPTVTTTYTVSSDNGNGCIGSETITVNVGSNPTLTLSASFNAICLGNSTILSASGASTYTWNPGVLTGSTTAVSPTVTTTYTATGDNGFGCTNTETITITVGPALSLTTTASSNTICAGSSATLTGSGATSYTWNPGAINGSTTIVTPSITTTYTVDADNGTGCVASETITINVNAIPSISIAATSTTLCSSGSVTMTATGATTYTWMPLSTTTASLVDTPTITTTYTVTGADAIGCSNTQTITINVGTTPTVSASSSATTICAGASATLTGAGATSYTWNPGALTGTTTVVTPSITTTYTVDGDNGAGCFGSNTITINVNSAPSLSIVTTSTLLCSSGSITLTASGGTTYTWSPISASTASVVDSPTITTTYTVSSDNGTGCIASETITINVGTSPSITITASPVGTICVGTTATLTASGAASYTWNPTSATTSVITDAPIVTTTYTITGDNGFGCTSTNTFVLDVAPGASISAVANPTAGCANSTFTLSGSGATTYTWMPMNISGTSITATPSVSTTYTVLGDNGTCIASATVIANITPGPANVTASVSGDITCLTSTVNLFGNTTSSPVTYLWDGPASYTSNVQNPTGIALDGTYTLTVTDALTSCTTLTMITVLSNTTIPNLTALASGSLGCVSNVTLTAASTSTNTLTYLWNGPLSYTANIQNPTTNTVGDYTVTASDAITGCSTTATITIGSTTVTPLFTATVSGSLTCIGDVTLTATPTSTNPVTYSWTGPSSFTSSIQSPTTTVAGDYTISLTDASSGCSSTSTITVGTNTVGPNLTANVSGSLTCIGDVTLTASSTSTNPVTYSWTGPSSFTSSVQSPTTIVAGDYTISLTDATSGCSSTSTITVGTNTVGPNLTATTSGSLGCATSVTLTAATTATNTLTYAWSGPSSFTSSIQSPTTSVAGDYTVTAIDAITGCSSSSTITIGTNTTIPVVGIAIPGPVLGCNTTVTLSVITAPTPTMSFSWSGPSSFTSTAQTPTTSVAGDYTVTVTDPTNGCSNTVAISVITDTTVPVISATVIPATCTGTITNNDGTIIISGYGATDTYDMSQAATYTGTATYITGNVIPLGGTLTNTLTNPATSIPYTIRVFSANGCFADVTLTLTPTTCTSSTGGNTLGMTKAVSTATFVNNNAYNVTYTLVAVNASTVDLTGFIIGESLDNAFPLPTTYSIISQPVITSLNSSLTINPGFNGTTDLQITSPLTSTLYAGKIDTIVFTVQINPNGFFGPFINSVTGFGVETGTGTFQSDSSNIGFAWDPDGDGDPTNNNIPTPISLNPNTQIGVAKSGTVSEILTDKTLDVTYVITVKNIGNDTIRFVQVLDTLRISSPAQYTIKSGPIATGNLVSNSNYNGVSDFGLLVANTCKLAPGEVQTITLILNITPNDVKSITNIAIGTGFGVNGGIVRDSSNAGTDPDPNGNGVATEPGENVPTVITLPDVNLFIPEVFTPDGDGKNDFFVIKGIEGRTVNLTVFNRWGNKVYQNDAYDNTWSGSPNVSGLIIGNSKLPQGTYYYVIEFADGADEPVNGYIVLQY